MGIDYNDILVRGNKRQALSDLQLQEKHIREINAKTIVEIGAMDGTSSLLFGCLAKELGGHLYSIEPKPKAKWRVNINDYGLNDFVTLIQKFSPWLNVPDRINSPIDYLLIDGDHRTRWAIVDYHYFFPFVRKGGFIAFHDYNGRKGVAAWVRRAIDIILEDDSEKIKEVVHNDTSDRGVIIFKKVVD
jgi:predicted O-methyltransferase YrrM